MDNQLDLTQFSYEQLAHALYAKGKAAGFHKITDKTKWRELVMAEKLGHACFPKISAGKHSDRYGADADTQTGLKAEYKSSAIEDRQLRNLLKQPRGQRGTTYAPLTVGGVYNGAYTYKAVDSYRQHQHYFGIFYEELCVLIIRVHGQEVDRQLREELDRRSKLVRPGSTNLNTVSINLDRTDLYEVAYRNEQWFNTQHQ